MRTKPTLQEARAMLALRANPDYKMFLAYMDRLSAEEMVRLLRCTELVELPRAQGRAAATESLRHMLVDIHTVVDSLEGKH